VLGGGREKKEDSVDPAVGLIVHKKLGDKVAKGEALCTIYYNSDARLPEARRLLEQAFQVAPQPLRETPPLVKGIIGESQGSVRGNK
jgi:thymidine phosphorylase